MLNETTGFTRLLIVVVYSVTTVTAVQLVTAVKNKTITKVISAYLEKGMN